MVEGGGDDRGVEVPWLDRHQQHEGAAAEGRVGRVPQQQEVVEVAVVVVVVGLGQQGRWRLQVVLQQVGPRWLIQPQEGVQLQPQLVPQIGTSSAACAFSVPGRASH